MYIYSAKCLKLASLFGLYVVSAGVVADWISAELGGHQTSSTQSSSGGGHFKAAIDLAGRMIEYRLFYQDLEGSIQQTHIHFKRPGINGGAVTFLCTNQKPSNDTSRFKVPVCPGTRQGTVTGTIQPKSLAKRPLASASLDTQWIEPGEFDELVNAIDAGSAYVEVHTTAQPGGEVWGKLPGR